MKSNMRFMALVGIFLSHGYAQSAFFMITYSKTGDIFFARFTWQDPFVLDYKGKAYGKASGTISYNVKDSKGNVSLSGVHDTGVASPLYQGNFAIPLSLQRPLSNDEFIWQAQPLDDRILDTAVTDFSNVQLLENPGEYNRFYEVLKGFIEKKFDGAYIRSRSWAEMAMRNRYTIWYYLRSIAAGVVLGHVLGKAMGYLRYYNYYHAK